MRIYLPKQAQEDDILPIIRGAIEHVKSGNGGQQPGPKDMGPTMRVVQQRILASGLFVDSKAVSDLVKKELAGNRPLSEVEASGYGG